jgi:hypothetical protein
MHASRKTLLEYFDARAAEYRNEMASGDLVEGRKTNPEQKENPVGLVPHCRRVLM